MPDHSQTGLTVHTVDLNFHGASGSIAVYLIPHSHGAVLVECGPGSSIPNLLSGIAALGLQPSQITDVLLTHIHLDHGGSAGWWARQGARIHVHPVGAPHLVNPEKLLTSAGRIYRQLMQTLWGDFLPVPEDKLVIHQDNEAFEVEGAAFPLYRCTWARLPSFCLYLPGCLFYRRYWRHSRGWHTPYPPANASAGTKSHSLAAKRSPPASRTAKRLLQPDCPDPFRDF